jgi:DNA-binding transcriptional MerR regulator
MEVSPRIPQKLFFRIGEVCELIKVQPHVLRYWETEFPMLAPQKNRAGQRIYRRRDVEMVLRIRDLLYEEKFTIAGAKKKLSDEMRSTSPRSKPTIREKEDVAPADATVKVAETEPPQSTRDHGSNSEQSMPDSTRRTAQTRRAVRALKRELEALLTMLKSDASIHR